MPHRNHTPLASQFLRRFLFTGDEGDADAVLKQADAAMYADKKSGRPDPIAS